MLFLMKMIFRIVVLVVFFVLPVSSLYSEGLVNPSYLYEKHRRQIEKSLFTELKGYLFISVSRDFSNDNQRRDYSKLKVQATRELSKYIAKRADISERSRIEFKVRGSQVVSRKVIDGKAHVTVATPLTSIEAVIANVKDSD